MVTISFARKKLTEYVLYFLNHKDITLFTSHRLIIDKFGCISRQKQKKWQLFKKDTILSGKKLAEIMLKDRINYVGEPTTVLFKKNLLEEPFGEYSKRKALFSADISSWLHLLEKGSAVYISEPLSLFRIHETQLQNYPGRPLDSKRDWEAYIRLWQKKHGPFS